MMLSELKARLETAWHDLTSEARADIEAALKDAEERASRLGPVIADAEADLKGLVSGTEPALKTAVATRLAKLKVDAALLIGEASKDT